MATSGDFEMAIDSRSAIFRHAWWSVARYMVSPTRRGRTDARPERSRFALDVVIDATDHAIAPPVTRSRDATVHAIARMFGTIASPNGVGLLRFVEAGPL